MPAPTPRPGQQESQRAELLRRTRNRGVNPLVYWVARGILQPFFHLYFRMSRIGREHIPQEGPVIFAANHRSFLDPFVIATLARRPIYFVAKKELFSNRLLAWVLNSLGAFPIDRGASDTDAMATAREILERGDGVLIFPEGTRTRPGSLGNPKRGVGRLALETGAPVIPVAVIGTEQIRNGIRVRPRKVRIRAGAPLTFPKVESPSPQLAGAVTERIWPCVMLQWEWLGGLPPARRVAVIGDGAQGAAAAMALAATGAQVELGCPSLERVSQIARTRISPAAPGLSLPATVTATPASALDLAQQDAVVIARPASPLQLLVTTARARELTNVLAAAGLDIETTICAGPEDWAQAAAPARRVAAA